MRTPLYLLDCAGDDLKRAIGWYDLQVLGLGESFLLHVEEALDRIEQYPALYQVDFGDVRRALTRRFAYAVYYRILAGIIEVVAILDCRSDPALAQARIVDQASH